MEKGSIKESSEPGSQPTLKVRGEGKAPFKSSFKTWIRTVAFLILCIFVPQQVAEAVEFDWRIIWHKPQVFSPSYLKNISQIDIPLSIKRILTDLSKRPEVNAIKISDQLILHLERPLNLSKQRIGEIYNWLKGKPCGSKALYDFLTHKGIQVIDQDVAVLALTIDILNEVVRPEGNPKVIKTSLFALSKASEFFGSKLYPVRLKLVQGERFNKLNEIQNNLISEASHPALTPNHLAPCVPFIAYIKEFLGISSPFPKYRVLFKIH